jgi:biotin carboxylase
MSRIGIWFNQGYSNLHQALRDLRAADTGGRYSLICSHPSAEFVGLQAADIPLVEPAFANDGQRLAFVRKTVLAHNVKVIIPSRKQAFMNKHAAFLADLGARVATVASSSTLRRIDNKGRLYAFLQDKGVVAVPAFACVKTKTEFNAAHRALARTQPKLCVKPTVGVYGSGFRVLKNSPDTLADLLNESLSMSVRGLRARLGSGTFPELMVMQYLEGDERSVDCLAYGGELVGGVVRRKSNSGVAAQVIEDHPDIMNQVRALTRLLKLNGMFNVQFKDSCGKPFLLEINTRLSGRSYYATLAGLNLPFLAAELFSGQKTVAELDFTQETGFGIGNVSSGIVIPVSAPCASACSFAPAIESV